MEVLKDNKTMFGVNFDENKKVLNKISTITSKILKMNWLDTLQNLSKMNLEMKKKKQNLLKMRNKFQNIQNLQRMNQKVKL